MKITIYGDNLGWIIDELVEDYKKFTQHEIVELHKNPDLVWSLSSGTYPQLSHLKHKKFFILHHVDMLKVNTYPFDIYNTADACFVPNKKTEKIAKERLNIPVYRIPYWLLSTRMIHTEGIRSKISQEGEIVIGYFQKDSEGDTNKPKLSKGPDMFLEVVKMLSKQFNIRVLLAGYGRKFLTENFDKNNIKYTYLERHEDMNELYDSIDWYFITSRYEGGPQSVLEASYKKIKVLSTDVGIASEILHPDCMCNDVNEFVEKFSDDLDRTKENYETIQEYLPRVGIKKFDIFFKLIMEKK